MKWIAGWLTWAYASNALALPASMPTVEEVPVCAANPPPCEDDNSVCWKCLTLGFYLENLGLRDDVLRLQSAYEESDERAEATERLAEHATKEARKLAQMPRAEPAWVIALWVIGGAVVGAGLGMGVGVALARR